MYFLLKMWAFVLHLRRTMLAAVQATAKRLIAPRYLMGQNNV